MAGKRKAGPERAALDLVALLRAAACHGIEAEVRGYAPFGDVLFIDFTLREPGRYPANATDLGSVDLHIGGTYAGDRTVYGARGVGIALAREAKIMDEARLATFEAMAGSGGANYQSSPESQRELLARAHNVRDRRLAYAAWMDAGCPEGTFEAYSAKEATFKP